MRSKLLTDRHSKVNVRRYLCICMTGACTPQRAPRPQAGGRAHNALQTGMPRAQAARRVQPPVKAKQSAPIHRVESMTKHTKHWAKHESLTSSVTIGIKHTSRFEERRTKLELLLRSIRQRYSDRLRIIVADDGGAPDKELLRSLGVRYVKMPANSGLSHGRNVLVQATRTSLIVLLDDDTVFHAGTSLAVLHQTLRQHPNAAVAAGCFLDLRYPNHTHPCFRARFRASEGGTVVQAQAVHTPVSAGCHRVHMATNFFMARTSLLRRFGWDARQRVMEHETFFYQLFLNEQPVFACPNVTVQHNGSLGAQSEYQKSSLRFKEGAFMQYLCKNFPEVERFDTTYNQWRCDQRTYCQPAWGSEFAFDGETCRTMEWDENDDRSTVVRPLVVPALQPPHLFPPLPGDAVGSGNGSRAAVRHHVKLLAVILTERRNTERRSSQRATWLRFRWHEARDSQTPVSWRYVYVRARSDESDEGALDVLHGDTVTLSSVREGYRNLVHKTIEALRWAAKVPRAARLCRHASSRALARPQAVSFDVLLKVDDDSMVHVGRLWAWLAKSAPRQATVAGIHRNPWSWLYGGRVQSGAQVVRANFTRRDLWRPNFFPPDFLKWAVTESAYAPTAYPPYATGGGYVLGSETVRSVLSLFDQQPRSSVIRIEDAQIGILSTKMGVTLTAIDGFRELPPALSQAGSLSQAGGEKHKEQMQQLRTALLLHRLPTAPQRVFLALVGASHRCKSHVVTFGCTYVP